MNAAYRSDRAKFSPENVLTRPWPHPRLHNRYYLACAHVDVTQITAARARKNVLPHVQSAPRTQCSLPHGRNPACRACTNIQMTLHACSAHAHSQHPHHSTKAAAPRPASLRWRTTESRDGSCTRAAHGGVSSIEMCLSRHPLTRSTGAANSDAGSTLSRCWYCDGKSRLQQAAAVAQKCVVSTPCGAAHRGSGQPEDVARNRRHSKQHIPAAERALELMEGQAAARVAAGSPA